MAMRDVTVGLDAAICEEANLQGTISFGSQTIVHPKSAVLALAAPITIGDRTIIEDHARIENVAPHEQQQQDTAATVATMAIGTDNIFESGCVVRSTSVGNGNWFEAKAETQPGSVIGSNCIIGSGVVIERDEIIPDNSIVVCIRDPLQNGGAAKRVVRRQKEYLMKAREALTHKYIDAFLDPKGPYALAKNHRIIASAHKP